MKHRLSLALVGAFVLAVLAAWVVLAGDGLEPTEPESTATTSTFRVTGMTCGGCEVSVRRMVKKIEGVEGVSASHQGGTATVTYQADKVAPDDIIAAIEELGYSAELASGEEEET